MRSDVCSKGGLVVPSHDFWLKVQQFERCFQEMFGSSGLHPAHVPECNREVAGQDTVLRSVDWISVPIPSDAVLLFARTRCFIRMRYDNEQFEGTRMQRQRRKLLKLATFL